MLNKQHLCKHECTFLYIYFFLSKSKRSEEGPTLFDRPFCLQLQAVLLSYITDPQLELVVVMLIVPFIVNVSGLSNFQNLPPLPR